MKKTKRLSVIILGLFLFLPFVRISPAQGSYVGIKEGDEYIWELSFYKENWGNYFPTYVEQTLSNLMPLEPMYTMTQVYMDWRYFYGHWAPPPQTEWPFEVLAISIEQTSPLLLPFDNTTITSTPLYATAGYRLVRTPDYNSYYNGTWYIVNDTSSFLRQTLNLTLAFSLYGIMNVPFAPTTINWTSFITEFLGVMNSKGGYYKNISATAQSNGYSLYVPTLGFENNTVPIGINLTYKPNGVLKNYEFFSGGKKLVKYWLYEPPVDPRVVLAIFVTTFVSVIIIFAAITTSLIVSMKKKRAPKTLEEIKKI